MMGESRCKFAVLMIVIRKVITEKMEFDKKKKKIKPKIPKEGKRTSHVAMLWESNLERRNSQCKTQRQGCV